jgi:hypothetical protein
MASSLERNDFVAVSSEPCCQHEYGNTVAILNGKSDTANARLILHFAMLLHAMEVGLSSEKLGFIFHCCHYFELILKLTVQS